MFTRLRFERLEDRLPLAADFNGDATVDEDDLSIWQAQYGAQQAGPEQGDDDGDGDVDGGDFISWQRGLGNVDPFAHNLIAYRPQGIHPDVLFPADAPAYDPFPRRPVREVDELSATLGPGIRINLDDDDLSGTPDGFDAGEVFRENDLIELRIRRLPGENPLILSVGAGLVLHYDYDRANPVPTNGGETDPIIFAGTSATVWVEYIIQTHGTPSISVVDPLTNTVHDTVRFHTFRSLIVAFGGRSQDPHDTDGDGSIGDVTDGAANREGIFDIAQGFYNTGWDVIAFDEAEIDNPAPFDPSQSLPYQEILTGFQSRFLNAHAVIGYSQGGGAAHDVTEALFTNEEMITRAVVYLDAVGHSSAGAENDWPEVTAFLLNIYSDVVEFPIDLGGGDIDDGEPMVYGATMEEINTTTDPAFDNTLDHFNIDDDPTVQQRIRARLQTWLTGR